MTTENKPLGNKPIVVVAAAAAAVRVFKST